MADMCREKDSVINDMQDRVRVYQEMQENIQREGERRAHYRDDDTIILPQASSSAHSYINGFDAENNRTPQMTPNQRNVPVLMRRPTLTKFDVPLPRHTMGKCYETVLLNHFYLMRFHVDGRKMTNCFVLQAVFVEKQLNMLLISCRMK